MTNISKEVKMFLDKSPCIRRNMDINLINISALARMIIKENNLESTALDATISAIRRYKLDYHNPIFDKASKIIKITPSLSTKGGLVSICLYVNEYNKLCKELCDIFDSQHINIFRLVQLEKYFELIIEEKNLEKLKTFFQTYKNKKIIDNLAEIKLDTNPTVQRTPGLIALLGTELAINNINMINILSSGSEITIYVKEKDLVKAHDTIHRLCFKEK